MPERPEPTFKEIFQAIKRIVDHGRGAGGSASGRRAAEPQPRRGLSPGLLLMAIVALVITIAAAVKNMK